jgi:ABC-2 type transport system permease protein
MPSSEPDTHPITGMPVRTAFRQCSKTAALAASGFLNESPLFLFDYLLRLLRVGVLLSLWRVILAGRGAVSGMTLGSVLTYTLIAEAFGEQLACRTGVEDAFWEGTMATRFLRPMGTVAQFAAEMFGRWSVSFCLFSVPLLLCAPLLRVNPLPASGEGGGLFLVSLALAVSIGLALDYLFAALMISLELSVWVVGRIRTAVSTLPSGALLPLALLPWGIGKLFGWLPFASMASAPLRIYTATGNPALLLAIQAGWAVVLWPLARIMWRANRERMVSHGG